MAGTLEISEHTVETHVSNLLKKLEMSSRVEIIAWAIRTGIGTVVEKPGGNQPDQTTRFLPDKDS